MREPLFHYEERLKTGTRILDVVEESERDPYLEAEPYDREHPPTLKPFQFDDALLACWVFVDMQCGWAQAPALEAQTPTEASEARKFRL